MQRAVELMRRSVRTLQNDSLLLNSFFLFLSSATMAGFGFIFWLLTAHAYTPKQVGVASTLISAMNFIAYLALFGFNTTFIAFLPKSKHRNQYIDTGLLVVAMAAVCLSAAYALAAPRVAPSLQQALGSWYMVAGFVVLVTSSAVNLVTDSIFIAYRAAKYNFFVDGLISSITQVSLPLLLIGLGAYGIFASAGISWLVALLCSLFFLIKRFGYSPQLLIRRQTLREVAHYSFLNYVANLLNLLPAMLAPLIVISQLGPSAAGYYYLAFMMATLLYTIAYSLSESMFAEGAYGEGELRTLLKKSTLTLLGVMIPASAAFAVLGPYMLLLFGKAYAANGRELVMLLALAGPFVATYGLGSTFLKITKQNNQLVIVNACFFVITAALAVYLVRFGLAWIGVAWLAGNVCTSIIVWGFVLRYSHSTHRTKQPSQPDIAF